MQAIAPMRTERFIPSPRLSTRFCADSAVFAAGSRRLRAVQESEEGQLPRCHVGEPASREPKDWLFTDFTYRPLRRAAPTRRSRQRQGRLLRFGPVPPRGLADFAPKDFDVESVCGAFKVPTLRNVELTAPYLPQWRPGTLRDAVLFTRRATPIRSAVSPAADGSVAKFNDLPEKYHGNVNVKEVPYDRRLGQGPRLSERDIDALVAFLQTLTDKRGE